MARRKTQRTRKVHKKTQKTKKGGMDVEYSRKRGRDDEPVSIRKKSKGERGPTPTFELEIPGKGKFLIKDYNELESTIKNQLGAMYPSDEFPNDEMIHLEEIPSELEVGETFYGIALSVDGNDIYADGQLTPIHTREPLILTIKLLKPYKYD